MRDREKDKLKLSEYWDMDVIEDGDDIANILDIADHWISQFESLQRDKAALIEVLEFYGDEENHDTIYELDEEAVEESWIATPAEISADRGERARTILLKMKG